MLNLPIFAKSFEAAAGRPGSVIVVFLATFSPIADGFGIDGVQRAGEYLAELVKRSAPPTALIGEISWITLGIFLPDASLDDTATFVAAVREATLEDDLELEPGEWAEIRVAIGFVQVLESESNPRSLLDMAAQRAEDDLTRYPQEWEYPIKIYDD